MPNDRPVTEFELAALNVIVHRGRIDGVRDRCMLQIGGFSDSLFPVFLPVAYNSDAVHYT